MASRLAGDDAATVSILTERIKEMEEAHATALNEAVSAARTEAIEQAAAELLAELGLDNSSKNAATSGDKAKKTKKKKGGKKN